MNTNTRMWSVQGEEGTFTEPASAISPQDASAIISFLSTQGKVGATSAEIVQALQFPFDPSSLQDDLERLVMMGALDRYGISLGARYTVAQKASPTDVGADLAAPTLAG